MPSLTRLPRALSTRLYTIAHPRHLSTTTPRLSSWSSGPAPPRLPKEDQALFETLQKQSTGAFSSPKPTQEPERSVVEEADRASLAATATATASGINQSPHADAELGVKAKVQTGDGEELHPNIRRGAKPEFEGEVNPKTGEVGGPKNEPLRWGSTENSGDWSYNGRVTDF